MTEIDNQITNLKSEINKLTNQSVMIDAELDLSLFKLAALKKDSEKFVSLYRTAINSVHQTSTISRSYDYFNTYIYPVVNKFVDWMNSFNFILVRSNSNLKNDLIKNIETSDPLLSLDSSSIDRIESFFGMGYKQFVLLLASLEKEGFLLFLNQINETSKFILKNLDQLESNDSKINSLMKEYERLNDIRFSNLIKPETFLTKPKTSEADDLQITIKKDESKANPLTLVVSLASIYLVLRGLP